MLWLGSSPEARDLVAAGGCGRWRAAGIIRGMPLTAMTGEAAARLRAARLNYPEAGRTAGELPGGYRPMRRTALPGSGPRVFAGAATALMSADP